MVVKRVEVLTIGDELLAPVIDGECYRNIRKLTFTVGPKLRIARVVGKPN